MAAFVDGSIIIGTSVDVGGINSGLYAIEKQFRRLGKFASAMLGVRLFAQLGKAALDAASDLQEVQNVIDVSFTSLNEQGEVVEDMRYKIEDFSKVCVTQFGMSELAAKQTAGSFAAMGKSMGLTMDEATDLAVQLTGLTADFASFYNISQEYAKVALNAVYTGETETLKRYGIVLTEANLQEFANQQNLGVTVKKLDARNKLILRYQYIMQATADMQGDFARTSDSWANSVRVLQEVWKQFMITLGSGLITILTPLINVLNVIIMKLIEMAKVLWQIISNIFGIEFQSFTDEMGKLADNTDEAVGATDDLADSLGKVNKAAKKVIASYDKLDVIPQKTGSASSGIGAGGGLSLDIDLPDYTGNGGVLDEIKSDIDNFYDWGKSIGDKISGMFDNIKWNKIFKKFENFGKHLAEFLNGLISTKMFKKAAKSLANSLNSIVDLSLGFTGEFDFEQLGTKIGESINTFFETFDFGDFADAIDGWVQGLSNTIKTALLTIDWELVFSSIKEFFENLDPETFAILVGFFALRQLISLGLQTAFVEGFSEGLGAVSLTTLLRNFVSQIGLDLGLMLSNLGSNIAFGLRFAFISAQGFITQTIPRFVMSIVSSIGTFFTSTLPMLARSVVAGFSTLFENLALGNSLNASFTYAFGNLATILTGVVTIATGAFTAIYNFVKMLTEGFSWLREVLMILGTALAAIGAVVLGVAASVAAPIAAIVAAALTAIVVLKEHWAEVTNWVADHVIAPIVNLWTTIVTWFSDYVITPLVSFFKGLGKRISQFFEGCWIIIKAVWIVVSQWFADNVITPLVTFFKSVVKTISKFFKNLWEKIKEIWSVVTTWFADNVITPLVNFFAPIVENISSFFSQIWDNVKEVWGGVVDWFSDIIDKVQQAFETFSTKVKEIFSGIWEGIKEGLKSAMNWVIEKIESGINFIIDNINKIIEGFNGVGDWAAGITGDKYGGVDLIPRVSIPRLAKGAVIPPNKEFLAVLGDQKSGTNIEAPLDTIKQAVAEVLAQMGGNNQPIVLQLNGKQIAKAVWDESDKRYKQTGKSSYA